MRLRNKILLLGAFVLVVVVLALLWRRQPSAAVTLPDGRVITLKEVSYGTNHHYVAGPFWARLVKPLVPQRYASRLPVKVLTYLTDTHTLMVWAHWQVSQTKGHERYASVVDESGLESGAAHYVGSAFFAGYAGLVGWNFANFPRRDRTLRVRVHVGPNDYSTPLAEFTLPNPTPRNFPEWKPGSLPVAYKQGVLECVLEEFATGIPHPSGSNSSPPARPVNAIRFTLREQGQATTNWRPVSLELRDASGNRAFPYLRTGLRLRGENHFWFDDVLWPGELAYRVTAEVARVAGFPTNDLIQARGLGIPAAANHTRVEIGAEREGAKLSSVELHYATSGPTHRGALRQNAYALIRLLPPTRGVRLAVVDGTDDRGQPVRLGTISGYPNGSWHLPVEIPEGAKSVNLRLAIHRSHFFEFTVAPARLEK